MDQKIETYNGGWKEDQWERVVQEPVTKQILRRKRGWIGHILRKPASSTTRPQALTWNPQEEQLRAECDGEGS